MWFEITDPDRLATPALVVFPRRIAENLKRVLAFVDSPKQICLHVKTHKSRDILKLCIAAGIVQFKCATLNELRMVATQDVDFVLLAMQPVGPIISKFAELASKNRQLQCATVVDNLITMYQLAAAAKQSDVSIEVLLDINNGMDRTGIRCGSEAIEIYQRISENEHLQAGGLHVYDGHIHDRAIADRKQHVDEAMVPVLKFRKQLLDRGFRVPRLITGGTPSFPVHAAHADRICSPGTTTLWDAGYGGSYSDLEFLPAAVLLTRVVSKMSDDVVCLDLGYKAIAAEMPPPRAQFLNANVLEEVGHSEEHLVVRVDKSSPLDVGDLLYAVPMHICPTVARYADLLVVDDGQVMGRWSVTARDREPNS